MFVPSNNAKISLISTPNWKNKLFKSLTAGYCFATVSRDFRTQLFRSPRVVFIFARNTKTCWAIVGRFLNWRTTPSRTQNYVCCKQFQRLQTELWIKGFSSPGACPTTTIPLSLERTEKSFAWELGVSCCFTLTVSGERSFLVAKQTVTASHSDTPTRKLYRGAGLCFLQTLQLLLPWRPHGKHRISA